MTAGVSSARISEDALPKGEELVWEGRSLVTKIVSDAEAEAKAIEDGWRSIETFLKDEAEAVAKKVKKVF